MAYLSEFEGDIFISYARFDDEPMKKGEDGWVSQLHTALEKFFRKRLGADPKSVLKKSDENWKTAVLAVRADGPPVCRARRRQAGSLSAMTGEDSCFPSAGTFSTCSMPGPGPQWLALIKADKPDTVVAEEVSQALESANVKNRVTYSAGKSLVDTLREVPCDAVLIVYGSCADDWLEQRGDELMAVDLNLKDLAPVRVYSVCADQPRLPYRSKAVLQIKRRDQPGWQQLMTAIPQRGGRP